MRYSKGNSLIELIVVVGISAAVFAATVPALVSFIEDQEINVVQRDFINDLRTARVESIARRDTVYFHRIRGDFANGWRVSLESDPTLHDGPDAADYKDSLIIERVATSRFQMTFVDPSNDFSGGQATPNSDEVYFFSPLGHFYSEVTVSEATPNDPATRGISFCYSGNGSYSEIYPNGFVKELYTSETYNFLNDCTLPTNAKRAEVDAQNPVAPEASDSQGAPANFGQSETDANAGPVEVDTQNPVDPEASDSQGAPANFGQSETDANAEPAEVDAQNPSASKWYENWKRKWKRKWKRGWNRAWR